MAGVSAFPFLGRCRCFICCHVLFCFTLLFCFVIAGGLERWESHGGGMVWWSVHGL